VEAALALARGGDVTPAEKLADALNQEFPMDTLMQDCWLPTVRAAIELQRHDSGKAIGVLHASVPYKLADPPPFSSGTMYPVYLRGEAYLGAGNGELAAGEFQKILDHPGVIVNFPLSALSHLGLGRARALSGDSAGARTAFSPSGETPILTSRSWSKPRRNTRSCGSCPWQETVLPRR
jgi:eukaryotic-like serine/threonine-protein kinase